jgi:hypothetical protein
MLVGTAAFDWSYVACHASACRVCATAGSVALLLRWVVSNADAGGLLLLVALPLGQSRCWWCKSSCCCAVSNAAGEWDDVAFHAAAGPVALMLVQVALMLRWDLSNAAAYGLMLLFTLLLGQSR